MEHRSVQTKRGAGSRAFRIPLLAAIPVAALLALVTWDAVTSDGVTYRLPFLTTGGVFFRHDIKLLGFTLYQLLMGLGAVTGWTVTVLRRGHCSLSRGKTALVAALFCAQFLLGSKAYFAIGKLVQNGVSAGVNLTGQNLFGGLYSTLLCVPLFARWFRQDKWDLLDDLVPLCLIPVIFTKLGCFTAGCCGARRQFFHRVPVRLPVQLLEAVLDLLLLALCLWLDGHDRKWRGKRWDPFPVMLIGYTLIRLLLEPLRTPGYVLLGFRMTQIHSVILLAVGIWMLRCSRRVTAGGAKRGSKNKTFGSSDGIANK